MTISPADGKLLLIHSHYGTTPGLFAMAEAAGQGVIRREIDLSPADFAKAKGVITTTHLDQLGFARFRPAMEDLLARGGRWFFNGHVMRELVSGLQTYVPIRNAKRADLVLVRLNAHPIFAGIEAASFEENRGVAGFYGRGHNPLPAGAVAITGIGPERLPLDWEWTLPSGGKIFSHAGNNIGGMGSVNPSHDLVAPRILSWTLGELDA